MNTKILSFLLILLLLSSLSYSRNLDELTEINPIGWETRSNSMNRPYFQPSFNNDYAILSSQPNDSIYYYNIPGSTPVNFTASAGEKMAVLFHPVTECSLFAIRFYNAGCDSNVNVILGVYKSPITLADLKSKYDPVTSGSETPLPDSLGNLLLANPLWGPFEVTLKASASTYITNTIDLAQHGSGYIDVGCNDFIVCYELKTDGCPTVMATTIFPSNYDYWASSLKYYNTVTPNGWRYRNYNWWFKALVYYYGCPPLSMKNITVIDDNYCSSETYRIKGTITSSFGCPELDTTFVVYSINGGDTITIGATCSNDTCFIDLPTECICGNSYTYYWKVCDTSGKCNTSIPISFITRCPKYDILFINDSASTRLDHLYTDILNYYGFKYDYWNVDLYGKPGQDVINNNNYKSIIWYTSQGSGSMSSMEEVIKAYLDGGGNLFFSSSEFLGDYYGYFDCGIGKGFTAQSGEFPFDYLKIDFGISDANVKCPDGDGQDTLYFGVAGDPLTGKYTAGFEADPYSLGYPKRWNDEVVARTIAGARDAFKVYSVADGANVPAGIVYDGNYKLVFLPWLFEATPDSVRYPLLRDILIWFGENTTPTIRNVKGPLDRIATRNPGPFNIYADVVDEDGDSLTVKLLYKGVGDSAMINAMQMTHITESTYFATIPAMDTTGFVYWQIQAISGNDTVYSVVPVRVMYDKTGKLNPDPAYYRFYIAPPKTQDANILLITDEGRLGVATSFVNNGYDFGYAKILDAMGLKYDYLNTSNGCPDTTILNPSQYSIVIVNADAGPGLFGLSYYATLFPTDSRNVMPFYLDRGGKLFLSGDEFFAYPCYLYNRRVLNRIEYVPMCWMGNLGGFKPGDFAYDYLGLINAWEDDGLNIGKSGTTADSIIGVAGDPITGVFSNNWLHFNSTLIDPAIWGNWSNALIYTNNSVPVSYAIRNSNGNYKVVFDGFMFAMLDSTTQYTFLSNVLNWFNTGTETGVASIFNTPANINSISEIRQKTIVPTSLALGQNYPNPFNPTTNIKYQVPGEGGQETGKRLFVSRPSSFVSLKIYNIAGQLVKTLVNNEQSPGYYSVQWDGKDDKGYDVPSGIYIYNIRVGNESISKRMIVVR